VPDFLAQTSLWDVMHPTAPHLAQPAGHDPQQESRRYFQDLVVFYHHETIGAALDKLARRHLRAAPVLLSAGLEDDESSSSDFGTFMGVIDPHNVLRHLVREVQDVQAKEEGKSQSLWAQLDEVGKDFSTRHVITVCGAFFVFFNVFMRLTTFFDSFCGFFLPFLIEFSLFC
jgi:hypothetical protein